MTSNGIQAVSPLVDAYPKRLTAVLPLELQEEIIDELSADLQNLKKCSFVCKRWRSRTYFHAFSSIRLQHTSVETFSSFRDNPFSFFTIYPRARRIRIVGSHQHHDGVSWNSSQLEALAGALQGLKDIGNASVLILENTNWEALAGSPIPSLMLSLDTISSLELSYVTFPQYTHFSELVAGFTALRHVVFQDIEFGDSQPVLQRLLAETIMMDDEKCALSFRGAGTFLRKSLHWVCHSPKTGDELTSKVGVHVSRYTDPSVILRLLGSSLNYLEIVSLADTSSDTIISTVDLSSNTSLRRLSLSSPFRVLSLNPWLNHVLLQITSPCLRVLDIAFAASRQFHLDEPFLKYLDKLLASPQFAELQLIQLIVVNGRLYPDLRLSMDSCVRSAMPSWDKKGVLRVSFV
ncbi:uncharacterized protein BT62DRAFT_217402 [Guyanagaster necrorhizus]|uniref:F-box domain-containing protein n=1 Tax=Guyanagaster necrorhizus TaxID=856835 RepID=A0A9P7VPS9_9AGAR|nr:uncharacterized protein BT62DRAFT_217402 [Guyanagaster necrorhizus MCA 3950]KAG7444639.1 hypothetical protein BT62DRAFT_217402 [Guyanagaster necrorhizus MCA 3950]